MRDDRSASALRTSNIGPTGVADAHQPVFEFGHEQHEVEDRIESHTRGYVKEGQTHYQTN